MSSDGTAADLGTGIARALLSLRKTLESPLDFQAFALRLGWHTKGIPGPVLTLTAPLENLQGALDGYKTSGAAQLDALLSAVKSAAEAISSLGGAAFDPSLAADNFADIFPKQLLQQLLLDFLGANHPTAKDVFGALGITRIAFTPISGNRPASMTESIAWPDITAVLSSPGDVLQRAFGWRAPTFDTARALDVIQNLAYTVNIPAFNDDQLLSEAEAIEGISIDKDAVRFQLDLPIVNQLLAGNPVTAGFRIHPLPAAGARLPGLAFLPYADGRFATTAKLDDTLTLAIETNFDLGNGIAIVLRPGESIRVIGGLANPATASPVQGSLKAILDYQPNGGTPVTIVGSRDGSRVEVQHLSGEAGLSLDAQNQPDLYLEADLRGGRVIISAGGADSFLRVILPSGGISANFDLALGLSSSRGVYFRGSDALELDVPLHLTLGPLELDSVDIALKPVDGAISVDVGASFHASLSVIQVAVSRMGFQGTLRFPGSGGNLGPADVALGFRAPDGVGLSLNVGIIQGGGFLNFDPGRQEYAGTLELVFADFLSLHAVGLITTKMPDGSSGFSLLIIITADFGPGIQLGFGFTLLAVGGLLGLNRAMLLQPLMDGIRTDSIESIMFPHDVVANATRIISDLRAIFPPQDGTFLVGPMAKLGWGEPTLISLSLGVIIEIPPGDIAIPGILKLNLPADEIAVLVLQVNFLGVLEFDKGRIYFFASLFDSHVLFITLEGELGLLMAFGDNANFVVSVGGFHPQFNPPPLPFPSPHRIEIDIINESYARIRCDGYFAVTSNTVQFGSHSEFFFGFDACNVQGHSGFDALIQFSPFHFTVTISTSFSVTVFDIGVFGIDIGLTLAGPTPFHAHGTASLSFFLFSVDIGIEFTWGDSRNTMLPPVEVMPLLSGEFNKQSNWKAVLPSGSNLLVVLRQMDPSETAMILHPVGTLQVSQRLVPLDFTLDKDGNQQPKDANYFTLDVTSNALSKRQTLKEPFAPAQFKNMDDAAKLSQQAYVQMDSGMELSAAGNQYASGTAITRNVRYDLTIIDTKLRRVFQRFVSYSGALFGHFLGGSSVAHSALSAYSKGQTQPYSEHVAVSPESFAVALQSNNKVYSADSGGFSSQAAAQDYISRAVAKEPTLTDTLHVLPGFEVAE